VEGGGTVWPQSQVRGGARKEVRVWGRAGLVSVAKCAGGGKEGAALAEKERVGAGRAKLRLGRAQAGTRRGGGRAGCGRAWSGRSAGDVRDAAQGFSTARAEEDDVGGGAWHPGAVFG